MLFFVTFQRKKEGKCKKEDTAGASLATGDEFSQFDNNQCKSEEQTTAATCEEDIGNQDTNSVEDDDDDDQDIHCNVHHDEDEATKCSTDEQLSSSEHAELEKDLSPQNKSANNNGATGDDTGEPTQL